MTQSLSPEFELLVRSQLGEPPYAEFKLAPAIMELSSFYHSFPGRPTPWDDKFALPAYLSYFLPLNYARLRGVWQEVERFLPTKEIKSIWDYGSGLGTTQWVLEDSPWLQPCPLICLEMSHTAVRTHRELADRRQGRWQPTFKEPVKPEPGALAVFSYSFLEMQDCLPRLEAFDHLLIVEPSTRDCGRKLMEWRDRFLEDGFQVLAPCTHSEACPLLTESNRDWCHQRTAFEAPEWWLELEDQLPMKNRTLTYSYLLLSRTVTDETWRGTARVIGDTLEERGKTRQMICQGPKREFLSWLHRHGTPPHIPHGALLKGVETCTPKGGEQRAGPETTLTWFD